jgi:hypothetical protein
LDLNYFKDLELIREVFLKNWEAGGKDGRRPCSKNGHFLADSMEGKKGERE